MDEVKAGHLWQLGRHRLWCGDARLNQLGWQADLVLTDPPFEMEARTVFGIITTLSDHYIVAGCGNHYMALCRRLEFHFEIISQRCKPQSSSDKKRPQILHWNNAFLTQPQIEHCFDRDLVGGYFPSVMPPYKSEIQGNYAKPIQWAIDLLKACHVQTVCDPFLGTGTVLIACEKLGKVCYGSEIDSDRCNLILKRWQHATKVEPLLISQKYAQN